MIRSLPPKEKKKFRILEKSLFQKNGENRAIFPKSFLIFWKNARISRKKCNLPANSTAQLQRCQRLWHFPSHLIPERSDSAAAEKKCDFSAPAEDLRLEYRFEIAGVCLPNRWHRIALIKRFHRMCPVS